MINEYYTLPYNKQQEIDKTKLIILEHCNQISVCHLELFNYIQSMTFFNRLNPNYVIKLQEYISLVINLYKIVKPKLRKIKNIKFDYLHLIEKYQNMLIQNKKLSLEKTKFLYLVFNNIEDELRLACEELGYL